MSGKIYDYVKKTVRINRYIENHIEKTDMRDKLGIQILIASAFFILSIVNIIASSYIMLIFTMIGCIINTASCVIAKVTGKIKVCSYSSIITCALMFSFFVIYGGNDGFSSLWMILEPFLAMIIMDFIAGFFASLLLQAFLIVVFWTPVREMLFYAYNEQFCLRFPIFFFVTFLLGLSITISLRRSQYNELKRQEELEELSRDAHDLARVDPLTGLANRRSAHEQFEKYTDAKQSHCVIIGDIDNFKSVNDTYGHEFGDEVLVVLAGYMKRMLPADYIKSRWGGEEFLFIANESVKGVYAKTEQLRKAIHRHEFKEKGVIVRVTITFGIAGYDGNEELDKVIERADKRLYKGKNSGRNRTVADD